MRSKKTKVYIEELARKHKIRVSQVEEIVESPFRFFAQIATEGDRKTMNFSSVRIIKWGLFSVKEGRKKFFREYNEKNKKTIGA